MTRKVVQNTRPSFRFSGGSGHETMSAVSQTLVTESSPEVGARSDMQLPLSSLKAGAMATQAWTKLPSQMNLCCLCMALSYSKLNQLAYFMPCMAACLVCFVMARSLKPEVSFHACFNLSRLCSRLVSHRRHTLAVALHCHA